MTYPKAVLVVLFLLPAFFPLKALTQTVTFNSETANPAQEPSKKTDFISVTVKPNDSLSAVLIALGVDVSSKTIDSFMRYNNLESTIVEVGDVLRVPNFLLVSANKNFSNQFSTETNPEYCGSFICFDEISTEENKEKPTESFLNKEAAKEKIIPKPARPSNTNISPEEEISTTSPSFEIPVPPPTADAVTTPTQTSSKKKEPTPNAPAVAKDKAATNTDSQATYTPPKTVRAQPAAPGLFKVDEDSAIRALERSLVSINALLLKYGQAEASLDFSFAYDLSNRADLIEITNGDEVNSTVGEIENTRSIYGANLGVAFGLPSDAQVRFQLPIQNINQETNILVSNDEIDGFALDAFGIGDVRISLAKTIAQEKGRRPDIIAQITYDTDWGSSKNEIQLGDDLQSVELSLRATKRQDPLVFTYGISRSIPIEKDDFEAGAVTQLSVSTLLAASPYTSLIFSLNNTFIDSATINGQIIRNSKSLNSSLNIGASSVIGNATYMSGGMVAGLTDSSNDYSAYIGFSKRFNF